MNRETWMIKSLFIWQQDSFWNFKNENVGITNITFLGPDERKEKVEGF